MSDVEYQRRLGALNLLEKMIRENTQAICQVLQADLRKPLQEALIAEVATVLDEIKLVRCRLSCWMHPRRARVPWALFPARARIHYEPLGQVLIIGPWNYPFQLTVLPLVGALAAGNRVVLKPSELAVHTSRLIADLVPRYFLAADVHVVEGGVPETTALLAQKFDHIFFTGSTAVGRIVMQAAAQNLTPVTLELGGKSPAIVTAAADIELAARRIVWGKCYNAGQTCVAPDYVLVDKRVSEPLRDALKRQMAAQFGPDPRLSESYGRIINARNWQRLDRLINEQQVAFGGSRDVQDLFIAPTLLYPVTWHDPIMQEEIFGPLLPLLEVEGLDEALRLIRQRPKPLAAYFFSQSTFEQKRFVDEISFGGGCINDVILHLSNPHLPFGGVGDSGMGRYHGEFSFRTFSHAKSVLRRYGFLDLAARYAPYTSDKLKILRWLFRV